MSDLEWYLDVGGKQSGPHSAKEIVEMVRGGKIPATSQVTAARMNGDWVRAQDLIEAYDELYAKPVIAQPIGGEAAFQTTSSDPDFTAPPRPTEQLEKSKIMTLNREELDRTPDPTEALFHAIQAVREKAHQKTGAPVASAAVTRESFGQALRPDGPKIPPQLILILTLVLIFGATIYGIVKLVGGKKNEDTAKTPAAVSRKNSESLPPPSRTAEGGLLNSQGTGSSAARTAPPVQPHSITPRTTDAAHSPARDERLMNKGTSPMGGGARYRDERDAPVEPAREFDEPDVEPPREGSEPVPVDPSQIPADRIIPEAGGFPTRVPGPGSYTAPIGQ